MISSDPSPELTVLNPMGTAPLVLSCPHAGRFYPPELIRVSARPVEELRQLEDAHMDALVRLAVAPDMPAVIAGHARAWLDINRHPEEIDPAMVDPFPPPSPHHGSARIAAGLGLMPTRVAGRPVYAERLPAATLRSRVQTVHRPYHERVGTLLADARHRHGYAILIDCHSMPSLPRDRAGRRGAEIVIGDRFGTSAESAVTHMLEEALRGAGFTTARNRPYAGGYIIERHGAPGHNIHALQVEMDRALYLDQATLDPIAAMPLQAGRLGDAVSRFRNMVSDRFGGAGLSAAAE